MKNILNVLHFDAGKNFSINLFMIKQLRKAIMEKVASVKHWIAIKKSKLCVNL